MSKKKKLAKAIRKAKKNGTTVTKFSQAMLELGYVIKDYKLDHSNLINNEPTIEIKLYHIAV